MGLPRNRKQNFTLLQKDKCAMGISAFQKSEGTPSNEENFEILRRYCMSLENLTSNSQAIEKRLSSIQDEDSTIEQTHDDPMSTCHSVLNKSFDPFLVAGSSLTQRHLGLIHTYMQFIGPMTWGTLSNTAYFGPNHVTHLCLRHSDAGALWTAIITEETIQRMSGQPRTQAMAIQRAEGRRALIYALKHRHQNLGAACLALVRASQAYLAFGSGEAQAVSGTAADQLIDSVGGLKQVLTLTSDIEPYYIASMYLFTLYTFTSRTKIVESSLRFLQTVQQILRYDKPGHRRAFRGRIDDILIEKDVPEGYLALEYNTIQLFNPFTHPSLTPSTELHKYRISLLLQLCPIFIEFDMDAIIDSLQRIKYFFMNNITKQPYAEYLTLQGAPIAALAAMCCHVRRSILMKYMPQRRLESELRTTEAIIDGWKVFRYISEQGQEDILRRLNGWLNHTPNQFEPFTAQEIDDLTSEIIQNWSDQNLVCT